MDQKQSLKGVIPLAGYNLRVERCRFTFKVSNIAYLHIPFWVEVDVCDCVDIRGDKIK